MSTTSEHERLQHAIDTRLAALHAPQQNFEADAQHAPRRKMIPFKRITAFAAAACFAIVCSMGVLAGTVPPVQRLFSLVGTELSLLLQPVELSSISNGVEMQVLAAINDNDMLTVYFSLQDVDGDHVNANTLAHHVQATGIMGPMHCRMLNYDETTDTAIYSVTGYGMREIEDKKTNVTLGTLLCDETMDNVDTGITAQSLAEQNLQPALQSDPQINASLTTFDPDYPDGSSEPVPVILTPGQPLTNWSGTLPWGDITGIGTVDDTLHIQVMPKDLGRYANASLYWIDNETGLPIQKEQSTFEYGSTIEEGAIRYSEYIEHVLPLPLDKDLSDMTLGYSATTYSGSISGDWQVTFTLDSVSDTQTVACSIMTDDWCVEQVTLSNMGVAIFGEGELNMDAVWPEIEVYDTSGNLIEMRGNSVSVDDHGTTLKDIFEIPLSREHIGRVLVAGQEIIFPS